MYFKVTVWDYDQYETNSFMGEVLIDFTIAQLDDEPFLYTLVDMDEDNPLRAVGFFFFDFYFIFFLKFL